MYIDEAKRAKENTIICSCFMVYNDIDVDDYFLCNYSRLTYSGEGLVMLQGMTVAASFAAAVANTIRYMKTKEVESEE